MRPRGTRPALPAVVLLAVLCAGCSGDDGSTMTGSSSTSPPVATASSGPAAPASPTGPPPEASQPPAEPTQAVPPGDVSSAAEPSGGPLTVTQVRVARQDGFDRVVLELAGQQPGVPGWRVAYEDDPRRDGSGDPVEVTGGAVLVVRVLGAGYPFDTGQQEAESVSVPGDTEVVQEVELGSVFEGQYEAFVGVREPAPFRVTRLTDPTRVVIDIDHP